MINNRSSGSRRSRSRSGGPRPQGGSQGQTGNRIDSRARGNAPQLLEKYKGLARDAQMQGDRVMTEYYHQFADHYFRVVAESRQRYEDQRRPDGYQGRADEDDGFEEGYEGEPANQERQDERGYQSRDDRPQNYQNRDDRAQGYQRDDRSQGYQGRDDGRDRQQQPRNDDRQQGYQRQPQSGSSSGTGGNGQSQAPRDQGYRANGSANGQDHYERQPQAQPPREDARAPAAQPNDARASGDGGSRTRRPRTSSPTDAAQPGRGDDGAARIDAATLPPSFASEPIAEAAPKPARRPRTLKRVETPAGDEGAHGEAAA